jgi:cell division protein FtsB
MLLRFSDERTIRALPTRNALPARVRRMRRGFGAVVLVTIAVVLVWWIGVLVRHAADPLGTGARRDAALEALPQHIDRMHADIDRLEREITELRRQNADVRDALGAPEEPRERASTL